MHDLLQQLMPILIFGAWIVISIYTANQKRKKKQQMQQRQYEMKQQPQQHTNHEPVYSGNTSPQSHSEDDPQTDLKRVLENIFGEPVEQTPPPHTQHDAEPVYQDDAKVEPTLTAESQTLQEQAAIQEQYAALMQRGDSIVPIDSTEKQPIPTEPEFAESVSFTRSELRHGILWAEILGKPVSMRT